MEENMSDNGKLSEYLKEEKEFFHTFTPILGIGWDQTWVKNAYYGEDGGFYHLFSSIYPNFNAAYNRLEELTYKSKDLIPAIGFELPIMDRIKEMLKEVGKILEKVPHEIENRDKRVILLENEYVDVTDRLGCFRIYYDYRIGRNAFQRAAIDSNRRFEDVVGKALRLYDVYTISVERDSKYYLPGIDEFGMVNWLNADAHTGSVMPKVLETNDRRPLFNEIPQKGIEDLIRNDPEISRKISRHASFRSLIDRDCTASIAKNRSDAKKMRKYHRQLRSELIKRSEKYRFLI